MIVDPILTWESYAAFESISSVVIAVFDNRGRMLHGNAGLHRITAQATPTFWQLITQPAPDTVLDAPADALGRIYSGKLTARGHGLSMITLTGTIYREAERVVLIAGYDMNEFEALSTSLLELNDEINNAYRELARTNRALEIREHEIRELSLTDTLTGVGNRRRLDEALAREVGRAVRFEAPLSLIILDIDHFKRVNDKWGHETGDRVLREMGGALLTMLRQTDIATRMGGEEFVVLLPATNLPEAVVCAERFRHDLRARGFDLPEAVTSSFGVACLRPGEAGASLLARADTALYAAKQQGRDRVVAAEASGKQDEAGGRS